MKRRLPTGIQTFAKIRADPYYYVDKTACVERLMEVGKHFFLSRPRRFGKSLLLDTLKELFEGNEPLFRGLAIHDRWDWSVRSPVIRLDFGGGNYRDLAGVESSVAVQLDAIESAAGITPRFHSAFAGDLNRIESLIRALFDAIPYEWHTRNEIARFEGYYASVLYSYLMATGLEIVVEDSSRRGRADLAVRCGGRVYLFEAKVVGSKPTGAALAQLPMERRSPERHFRVRLRCSSKQHDSPAGHVTVRVPLPPVQEHTAASCRTGVQNSMQGRTS